MRRPARRVTLLRVTRRITPGVLPAARWSREHGPPSQVVALKLILHTITYNAINSIYEGKWQIITYNGMRRKSLEELRAANRVRQKRWREKNRRTHRERVLELYGRAKAQGFFRDGVTPEEVARLARAMEAGRVGSGVTDNVTDNVTLREEQHYGPVVGWDEMEPEQEGGHGGGRGWAGDKAGIGRGMESQPGHAADERRVSDQCGVEESPGARGIGSGRDQGRIGPESGLSGRGAGTERTDQTPEERRVAQWLEARTRKPVGVEVEIVL
jgi:hypothetical protein